jgi:hypothetical protein
VLSNSRQLLGPLNADIGEDTTVVRNGAICWRLKYAIDDSFHRVFQLSNDQKYGKVATTTPEVKHLSWSEGSETKTLARIC